MRKMACIVFILFTLVILASCSPTQTVSVVPSSSNPLTDDVSSEPEPANLGNVALTKDQSDKLSALLTGALNMSDISSGNSTYFKDPSDLRVKDLLGFVYIILNNMPESVGAESVVTTSPISSDLVKYIIYSAFGELYEPKEGDCCGERLAFAGENFMMEPGDDYLITAYPYSFSHDYSGYLLVKYYMISYDMAVSKYLGKGEAVIFEDVDSHFDYTLLSLSKSNDEFAFSSAEASSNLPKNASNTYVAGNAIDGNDNTAWATDNGIDEWIKLSFDKPNSINGLVLHFGDWSSEDSFVEHSLPECCEIEFSDGTTLTDEYCETFEIGDDTCCIFDKPINTSYVKISITGVVQGNGLNWNTYVSEIKPI